MPDYMASISVDNGTVWESWCHVAQDYSTCDADPKTHARALVGEGLAKNCSNVTVPATTCSGGVGQADGFVTFDTITTACVEPRSVFFDATLPTFNLPEAASASPDSFNIFDGVFWYIVFGVLGGLLLLSACCAKKKEVAAPQVPAAALAGTQESQERPRAPPLATAAYASPQSTSNIPVALYAHPSRPPPRPPRAIGYVEGESRQVALV